MVLPQRAPFPGSPSQEIMIRQLILFLFVCALVCVPSTVLSAGPIRRNEDQQVINQKDHVILSDKKHSNYLSKMGKKLFVEKFKKENDVVIDDKEIKFYYFSAYDTDHNELLDGTELRNARIDYEFDYVDDVEHSYLHELDQEVEDVLYEDDINNDGYISWNEYLESEQLHDILFYNS